MAVHTHASHTPRPSHTLSASSLQHAPKVPWVRLPPHVQPCMPSKPCRIDMTAASLATAETKKSDHGMTAPHKDPALLIFPLHFCPSFCNRYNPERRRSMQAKRCVCTRYLTLPTITPELGMHDVERSDVLGSGVISEGISCGETSGCLRLRNDMIVVLQLAPSLIDEKE